VRIGPGSYWVNGHCENFNGRPQDECLNGEIIYSVKSAQVVTGQQRWEYNTRCPDPALGYRPPAPAAYRLSAFSGQIACWLNRTLNALTRCFRKLLDGFGLDDYDEKVIRKV